MSQDSPVNEQEPDMIMTKDGVPYKTRQAANLSMGAKKLDSSVYEVVELEPKQFVIAKKPVDAEAPAPAVPDAPIAPVAAVVAPVAPAKTAEQYWVLSFQDRFSKNETEAVPLSVNGETLVFHRGKEVIVPQRFRECADNTRQQIFEHFNDSIINEENSGRKVIGWKKTYPYTVVRESNEAEFKAMKAKGDEELRALKEQQG
jgi:hypothetical protein